MTRLADLGGGAHRRFFDPPSVALERDAGGDFLAIALGSGDRTRPLSRRAGDALFMLRDADVGKGFPEGNPAPITVADLHDASADPLGSSDAEVARAAREELAAARGWRVDLAVGEKSLSRLVAFDGQLLATTYEGRLDPDTDPCSPALDTTRRFYRLDLLTARPGDAADAAPSEGARGRYTLLGGSGIPSAPLVLFPPGSGDVEVLVDRAVVDRIEQRLSRVYWHAK